MPHGSDPGTLGPVFLSYVLSFIYVGIYWNNHHHMLFAAQKVNGGILWANLHLLFWISLIPFVTGWMGENHYAALTVALYGVVLLMAAVAYFILARALVNYQDQDSALSSALRRDYKGKVSVVLYAAGVLLSFVQPWMAMTAYVVVAIMWVIPDRRIEHAIAE